MPEVNVKTKFEIGDVVCWTVSVNKYKRCSRCDSMHIDRTEEVIERGRVAGWSVSEYGTMGMSVSYTVTPFDREDDGVTKVPIDEERLSLCDDE